MFSQLSLNRAGNTICTLEQNYQGTVHRVFTNSLAVFTSSQQTVITSLGAFNEIALPIQKVGIRGGTRKNLFFYILTSRSPNRCSTPQIPAFPDQYILSQSLHNTPKVAAAGGWSLNRGRGAGGGAISISWLSPLFTYCPTMCASQKLPAVNWYAAKRYLALKLCEASVLH